MHYTYMLKCKDGTYYTGYTNDLEKRVQAHNEGKGAKYTKGRGPVELIYFEEYEDKSIAMRREWEIKRLTRSQKEELHKKNNKQIKVEKYSDLSRYKDHTKGEGRNE